MKSARARPRLLVLAAACALGAACGGPSEPHGSPVLTQIYWVAAGGESSLAWSLDPNVTMVSPLPPFASEIDFVFDRRLDGAKIEDLVTTNGVTAVMPKAEAAVHVTWTDMGTAMSDPPFHLTVDYNSLPRFGGLSSYVYARPDVPGFPASHTLTFDLVPTLLTSAYNDPADLPTPPVTVKTSAFAAVLVPTTSPVVPSFQLPLTFTNRLPKAPATSPSVHVKAHGADVPYKLLGDASLASRWYLAAADCLGGWPPGTTFEVTIDAAFGDAFGAQLGQPATMTFSTNAGAAAPSTCPIPDAGAADGGVPDAASTAPDAGASDVPVEAGAADAGAGDAADDASAD
ncbi:MAG TPA: hypothetical protein VHL80_19270 [Polyangia bacterium]|nr:hypothetical protein [Polyangia bacterium]